MFCFLGLVGLYPRNWWDDIPWKTTVWEWWRSTGTRQLRFLQGNKQILVVGRWKGRYLEFYQQLICLVGRAKTWWTRRDKSKNSIRFEFSEVIQLSSPVLPLTFVANVKRGENNAEWYFCLSFFVSLPFNQWCRLNLPLVPSLQVLNYTETFYAPPVVMVTVSHLYDSNNVYSVKPENNVLNAWIEVK